jgi:hypothetical protein
VPRAAREDIFGTQEYVVTIGSWDISQSPAGANIFGAGMWINYSAGDGNWSGWKSLGGAFANQYPAVAVVGGNAHAFGIGTDNQVYHRWATPGIDQVEATWDRLPFLPNGNLANGGFQALAASARGSNNFTGASLGNQIIDVVVLAQNGTAWHAEYNGQAGSASNWEQVPQPSEGAGVDAVYVTSTDLSTFEVLQIGSEPDPSIYASSSPGKWVSLAVPQTWRNCGTIGSAFTSSNAGHLDFYELPDNGGTLYHDPYGPNPNGTPGLEYCR